MSPIRRAGVERYRDHRIVLYDQGGTGWVVAIYRNATSGRGRPSVRLRNMVPNGLDALVEEARRSIDLALDGPHWAREP